MHPRSPWHGGPPDFKELAERAPDFSKHVKYASDGSAHVDFQDAEAVRALTSALLLRHYGLHVEPPTDRLCPPVPNRLNYILWLQDVLAHSWQPESILEGSPASVCPLGRHAAPRGLGQAKKLDTDDDGERPAKRARHASSSASSGGPAPQLSGGPAPQLSGGPAPQLVRALDIGTGALAIYALLGVASDARWSFCGTDIDEASLESARRIISDERNEAAIPGLSQRIKLIRKRGEEPLIPVENEAHERGPLFHLTMCNPPFYASQVDMELGAERKSQPPSAVCSGTPGEMITEGGEVSFVSRMIRQSLELRGRVLWYTSMLGLLGSVAGVVEELKERGVNNYSITEFEQGRTKRWAVAWSLTNFRLPNDPSRASKALQGLQPPSNERSRRLNIPAGRTDDSISDLIEMELGRFGRVARESREDGGLKGVCHAWIGRDTWSRQARRARARADAEAAAAAAADGAEGGSAPSKDDVNDPSPGTEPLFCVRCFVPAPTPSPTKATPPTSQAAAGDQEVVLQWTYGPSSSLRLFESFSASFFDGLQKALLERTARDPQR